MTSGQHPADELRMSLPAEPSAQRIARSAIRERWQAMDEQVLTDLLLIVSELVSNAVRYGRPDIELSMRAAPVSIDVSVLDHGPELPPTTLRPVDMWTAESGRGLHIVDRLSSQWGVDPLPDEPGKAVWASLLPSADS